MDTVFHLWKVPKEGWDNGDEFSRRGIYPTGELMGTFRTREGAKEQKEILNEGSPSDRFDEQPYAFIIHSTRLEDGR